MSRYSQLQKKAINNDPHRYDNESYLINVKNIKLPFVSARGMEVEPIYTGQVIITKIRNKKVPIPHGVGRSIIFHTESNQYHATKEFYDGDWTIGMMNGNGTHKLISELGTIEYSGPFVNNVKSGFGKMTIGNGMQTQVITARWENDIIVGKGIIEYANGDKYMGELSGYLPFKHGKGSYATHDGKFIGGMWKTDIPHGHIICQDNGLEFCGWYEEGVLDMRKCSITYPNGDKYLGPVCDLGIGTIETFVPHGHGVLHMRHGAKYIGFWDKGLMHGYGFLYTPSGDYYNGYWSEGCRHGYGIIFSRIGSHAIEYYWNQNIPGKPIRS